jgi:hypothetical protein
VIIHRQRPIGSLSLVLVAVLMVPFAMVGGVGAWLVAAVVWVGVVALLVRRYKGRRESGNIPPWIV